jgi:hypothetical protein
VSLPVIEAALDGYLKCAQRLAPFGIGTVHGYGYRLEAEDRRRLMGMIEEHFVNRTLQAKTIVSGQFAAATA